MSAPDRVVELVDRFAGNIDEYRSLRYKEAQVRVDFVDPLFEALGWDVYNRKGYAERYREVVTEASLRIGAAVKAPDYSFRVGGDRKFFVETKKPAVTVGSDVNAAYQLRRYAWSAHLPLSILTDFEDFAVYDCRVKPVATDKPTVARIQFLPFTAYADRWDELAAVFSPTAIMRGAFDRYAESETGKRGTAEVDDVFLGEIESWRTVLARNLALRNPGLTQRELNIAVQSTIDRIIFLRICEDRGIESYGRLLGQTNGTGIYGRLTQLFREADARYNSGLFHFEDERGRPEASDGLTLSLSLDDKPLREIIRGLYYPDSPYEFSVVSAAILGQVYEQFLGQVIRLTPGHRAVVEVKPEVKKAGGIKYTPTYISECLVAKTLERLLQDKSPRDAAGASTQGASRRPEAHPVRVLDLSCGSGSILLVAYQYLLDWHLDWYNEHLAPLLCGGRTPTSPEVQRLLPGAPEPQSRRARRKAAPLPIYEDAGGQWRLTTNERKRILLTHIYGVDIDPQAVEVTKLSLLLKVLEGETERTLGTQLQLFQERALPDLGQNIKCGNSLIGPEFYDGQQMGLLDDGLRYRVNAFDWHAEYPQVFAADGGGFDVVIGNPPYIRIQTLNEWAPLEVEYYKTAYRSASAGNYDIYAVFVERGLSLLSERGKLGFILPHKFFNAKYGKPLRELLADGRHLEEVVHFGDQQVFRGVTTYTCLMILDKAGVDRCDVTKVADLTAWRSDGSGTQGTIPAAGFTSEEWHLPVGPGAALYERLHEMPVTLGSVASRMYQGCITSADPVYLFKEWRASDVSDMTEVFSKELGEWVTLESDVLRKVVRSGDVQRHWAKATARVLYPYQVEGRTARLLSAAQMRDRYPLTWRYLLRNKKRLEDREKGKFRDDHWHRFGRTQNLGMWEQPKLMVPYMIHDLAAYLDEDEHYYFINVTTGGYGITTDGSQLGLAYLCGLLNSRVLDWYLKSISTTFHGAYFAANKQYIERLPIRVIDFSDDADRARHDRMVAYVEQMRLLHQRLSAAQLAQDRTAIRRQIDATDRQINQLVCELYHLTDDEMATVEAGAR